MTQQFHEGEEVEVQYDDGEGGPRDIIWRKAKIVGRDIVTYCICDVCNSGWVVRFPDGSIAVFDAEHIRAAPFENSGLNEELQKHEISKRDFAGRKGENPSWE